MAELTTIELFAGIGCVSRGFAAAGFAPLLLTDLDVAARDTFLENSPGGPPYLVEDVGRLTVRRLRDAVDGREVTGLLGCPPCQGFSAAGKRDAADPQNRLLVDFFAVARGLSVRFFVMENVPAIIDQDLFREQLRAVRRRYAVWAGPLNAALYGLPQTRQRCIVIGYDRELGVNPTPPPVTHFGRRAVFDYGAGRCVVPDAASAQDLLGPYPRIGGAKIDAAAWLPDDPERLEDLVTVGDAIGDLPVVGCPDGERVAGRAVSVYATSCGAGGEIWNHVPWCHRPALVARLAAVPEGGDDPDRRRYYSQAYSRLHRRGLARTVTTNFHNAGSGRFTHFRAPRTLTVREAARLQGIPDDFRFIRYRSWQERLVGNAFPVPWARRLAEHVRSQIGSVIAHGSRDEARDS